jgi:hypothetical protein
MGHEQCLYRSNAARQGTVVLLLKIFNGGDEKLIAFLSHSEALAALLLEVGRMRPATAVKRACLLQACRKKNYSPSIVASSRRIGLFSLSRSCDRFIGS